MTNLRGPAYNCSMTSCFCWNPIAPNVALLTVIYWSIWLKSPNLSNTLHKFSFYWLCIWFCSCRKICVHCKCRREDRSCSDSHARRDGEDGHKADVRLPEELDVRRWLWVCAGGVRLGPTRTQTRTGIGLSSLSLIKLSQYQEFTFLKH